MLNVRYRCSKITCFIFNNIFLQKNVSHKIYAIQVRLMFVSTVVVLREPNPQLKPMGLSLF